MLRGRKDWWFAPSGFFTSWVAVSFQRRPLFHAVIFSLQDPLQNGTSKQTASAKGTVTVSVNCQHPGQNNSSSRPPHSYNSDPKATNSANKIHIESDNNPRSKLPVTSTENKTHVPGLMKPAIQIAADKLTKSLGTNNRVTITVPNGMKSSE